jgi:ATP-binding cassette subfamily F protein uup
MAGGNVLSVEGLTKRFGERLIFEDLHFGLDQGQKAALVARNGTGKSTLMKVLLGIEGADSGTVTFSGQARVAHLSQEHGLDLDRTILDNLFQADNAAMRAIRRYEAATQGDDAEALQSAYDDMDRAGAWSYEAQAKEILGKLGLHETERFVDNLSGGEKRRVALAKCLIEQPDLLLLDEPTNHLDLGMIEWLEGFLARAKTTLLMVTHDRFFLEVVCDTIFELDSFGLHKYSGNWSAFLEKKSERSANEHAQRDRARSIMKRELEWVRATPQARTTKSKSRLDAFQGLKTRAGVRLEEDEVRLELDPARLGGKILELHKVKKSYGERVILDGWTYHFKPGERIGLVGDNGAGKSTLIRLMTAEDEPDGGKVVVGDTVVFGHFSQEPPEFDEGMKVIEALYEIAEFMPLKKGQKLSAGQLLERFLFPRNRQHDYIHKLSGGERKRLHLLRVLMANPNFLVFDEPTNDLDVFTLGILEEFLLDFPGCLLLVSHDRYFMDKLVDHIFILDGSGGVRDFPGNYTQFRAAADEEDKAETAIKTAQAKAEAAQKASEGPAAPKGDYSQRLSYKEKREYEGLEGVIADLESNKKKLELKMSDPGLGHEEMSQMAIELSQVTANIETKTERWIELDERA